MRDTLRASGEAFARELTEAGFDMQYRVVAESGHGFLNRPGTSHFDDGIGIMHAWLGRHDDAAWAERN